jgi:hypothetical protein
LRSGAQRSAAAAAARLRRARELLLELLVAVLQLLDLAGELPHLVLQAIEPHHQFGFGQLRARRRDGAEAGGGQHERQNENSCHG